MKENTSKPEKMENKIKSPYRLEWKLNLTDEGRLSCNSKYQVWETTDGQYRIYRMETEGKPEEIIIQFGICKKEDKTWWSIKADKLGPGYPRYEKSLELALEVVTEYLTSLDKYSEITSNAKELIKVAKELGLSEGGKKIVKKTLKREGKKMESTMTESKGTENAEVQNEEKETSVENNVEVEETNTNNSTEEKEHKKVMYISEEDARRMLTAAGFKTANECSHAKLFVKIEGLKECESSLRTPEDVEDAMLLKKCLKALSEGEKIDIIPEEEEKPTKKSSAKAEVEDTTEEEESTTPKTVSSVTDNSSKEDTEMSSSTATVAAPAKRRGRPPKNASVTSGGVSATPKVEKVKPVKATTPRKTGEKRPGIIESIREVMREATKHDPITKADVMKKLMKKFPDRESKSMESTLSTKLSDWMRGEKVLADYKDMKVRVLDKDGQKLYYTVK